MNIIATVQPITPPIDVLLVLPYSPNVTIQPTAPETITIVDKGVVSRVTIVPRNIRVASLQLPTIPTVSIYGA